MAKARYWNMHPRSDWADHVYEGDSIDIEDRICVANTDANARLISACPEMLEGLKRAVNVCKQWPREHKDFDRVQDNVDYFKSIISKATGV